MFKLFKDLFEYLKILLKKWYVYLGILPGLYGNIDFIYGIKLPNFINEYIGYFTLFLFFLASFNTWKEMKDKLKNPVNYEIIYKIEEINYGLDENIKKAENEILELEKELVNIKNKESNNTKLEMKVCEMIGNITTFLPNENEKIENRINELILYIKELEDIQKLYFDWKKIVFFIKNTGNLYDENINIKIVNYKGIILQDEDLEFKLRNINEYPENISSMMRLNNAQIFYNSQKNEIPYRKEIGEYHFELRDLHINDKAEIFYLGEGIIIGKGNLEFSFQIKSKNTREIINKNLKFTV